MQTTRTLAEAPRDGYGFVEQSYPYTQAGGHPAGLTSTLELASAPDPADPGVRLAEASDIIVQAPPGLYADPGAAAQCAQPLLSAQPCPAGSQVGVYAIRYWAGNAVFGAILDMKPKAGESAELGLAEQGVLAFAVHGRLAASPSGYRLALELAGLPAQGVRSVQMTLWGVPAEAAHDPERGLFCSLSGPTSSWSCTGGGASAGYPQLPFLTMPSDCAAGPQSALAWVDSWQQRSLWASAQATLPAASGCQALDFRPALAVAGDTLLAEAPVGLSVGLDVFEASGEDGESASLAPPLLRSVTVALPAGVTLNPAGAQGLRACPASGPEGFGLATGAGADGQPLAPGEVGEGEAEGQDGLKRLAAGRCPEASTVGEAQADSPLLGRELQGRVYLAQPACGAAGQSPCTQRDAAAGDLYHVYVELGGVAEPHRPGVVVKVAVQLRADPATGRLTASIPEAPQLPLTRLALQLKGGPRALLANPAACGAGAATAELLSWSAAGTTPEGLLVAGAAPVAVSSSYEVNGCAGQLGLAPGFLAGTLSSQAGQPSPLTVTVTREPADQYLSSLQVRLPPGLLGLLASVTSCPQDAARQAACPASSRIGGSLVAAGAGDYPLALAGEVYLTGPYRGAPFGLLIVTRAQIGPFDLGTIATRAGVGVDPRTGALSIATDPLPQILLGVPLRLRRLTLTLDRPGFLLNPTGCSAKRIAARVAGEQGALASVSSPFAAWGCRELAFKPRVSLSLRATHGRTAALDVRVAFPPYRPGAEANLEAARLTLPPTLSARLAALQGSCEAVLFDRDPATCPGSSLIGAARARTPVLAHTLAGPVYLVAHGAARLPSLVAVLQGEGVRLDLSGASEIGRRGAIGLAFGSLPDVPIQSVELNLPSGPHALLGATAALCGAHRRSAPPTAIVALRAQNGLRLQRSVPLALPGCRPPWPRPWRRQKVLNVSI